MLNEENGTIKVTWTLKDFINGKPEVFLRWTDKYEESLNILFMSKYEATKLICQLENALKEMERKEEKIQRIISKTDFSQLYFDFDHRYNKYPIQISRAEAFGKAFADGLIDKDTYDAAWEYYGNLWNYVGD